MPTSLQSVMAEIAVSVSDLRKSPTAVMEQAAGAAVAILNNDRVMGYMVPPPLFEALLEALDDADLAGIVKARADEVPIKVSLSEL